MFRSVTLYLTTILVAGSIMSAIGAKVAATGAETINERNAAIQAAIDAHL